MGSKIFLEIRVARYPDGKYFLSYVAGSKLFNGQKEDGEEIDSGGGFEVDDVRQMYLAYQKILKNYRGAPCGLAEFEDSPIPKLEKNILTTFNEKHNHQARRIIL